MKTKDNQIAAVAEAHQRKIHERLAFLHQQVKDRQMQDIPESEKEILNFAYENETQIKWASNRMLQTLDRIRDRCNRTEARILEGDTNFNSCGILQGLENDLDRAMMEVKSFEKARYVYRHIIA